jgi:hypothetical protein
MLLRWLPAQIADRWCRIGNAKELIHAVSDKALNRALRGVDDRSGWSVAAYKRQNKTATVGGRSSPALPDATPEGYDTEQVFSIDPTVMLIVDENMLLAAMPDFILFLLRNKIEAR